MDMSFLLAPNIGPKSGKPASARQLSIGPLLQNQLEKRCGKVPPRRGDAEDEGEAQKCRFLVSPKVTGRKRACFGFVGAQECRPQGREVALFLKRTHGHMCEEIADVERGVTVAKRIEIDQARLVTGN
jgi:hypothetical protein